MKIPFICVKCVKKEAKTSELIVYAEWCDESMYKITCPRGHVTYTCIQEQKFEILFDSGVLALLDGYAREAIASIASALERLLEFYIKVVCYERGIKPQEYEEAWKEVSNQSERQYGIFHFFYLLEHGEPLKPSLANMIPRSYKKSWSAFRNNVIHKGYVPSIKESFDYIDMVYKKMVVLTEDLKNNYRKSIDKTIREHVAKSAKLAKSKRISVMSIPTLISLSSAKSPDKNLNKALERLKRNKKRLYSK